MKKLLIGILLLVVVCLCTISYASMEDNAVNPVRNQAMLNENYSVAYVYCDVPTSATVLDRRDEYDVYEEENLEITRYDEISDTVPEAFRLLDFSEVTSEKEYINLLYEALVPFLPEGVRFSDFKISMESLTETEEYKQKDDEYPVSQNTTESITSGEQHFSFVLCIDEVATNASASITVKDGRVTEILIEDMRRFVPYLGLTLDKEKLASIVEEVDSGWAFVSTECTVERKSVLAAGDEKLYLVIDTEIVETMNDGFVFPMFRSYYVELASKKE